MRSCARALVRSCARALAEAHDDDDGDGDDDDDEESENSDDERFRAGFRQFSELQNMGGDDDSTQLRQQLRDERVLRESAERRCANAEAQVESLKGIIELNKIG